MELAIPDGGAQFSSYTDLVVDCSWKAAESIHESPIDDDRARK